MNRRRLRLSSIIICIYASLNAQAADESALLKAFAGSCEGAANETFDGPTIINAVETWLPTLADSHPNHGTNLTRVQEIVTGGPTESNFNAYRSSVLLLLKHSFAKLQARLQGNPEAMLASVLSRDEIATFESIGLHLRPSSRPRDGIRYEIYGDSAIATGTLLSLVTDPYLIRYLQNEIPLIETLLVSLDRAIDGSSPRKSESELAAEIQVQALMRDEKSPYYGAVELVAFLGHGDSPYSVRFRGKETLNSWEREWNRQLASRDSQLPPILLSPSQKFIAFIASFHGSTMRQIRQFYPDIPFGPVGDYTLWLRSNAIFAPKQELLIRSWISLESSSFIFAPGVPAAPDFWIIPEIYRDL